MLLITITLHANHSTRPFNLLPSDTPFAHEKNPRFPDLVFARSVLLSHYQNIQYFKFDITHCQFEN